MSVIPYVENPAWADGFGGGTPDTAAKKNTIEQGITDVSLAPAVRAYHNAAQSITTATWTSLALNSERFDQVGGVASNQHDLVTNNSRLICRYAGVYQISGTATFAANATGERYIRIFLNNATILALHNDTEVSAADTHSLAISTLYALAVNDFVELQVFQNSGAGLNVNSAANYSPEFMFVRVA